MNTTQLEILINLIEKKQNINTHLYGLKSEQSGIKPYLEYFKNTDNGNGYEIYETEEELKNCTEINIKMHIDLLKQNLIELIYILEDFQDVKIDNDIKKAKREM